MNNIKVISANRSKIKGYDVFVDTNNNTCIGKCINYDNKGNYNNINNDFEILSKNKYLYNFLCTDYSLEVVALYILSENNNLQYIEGLKEYARLIKRFNIQLYKNIESSEKDNKHLIDLILK